MKEWYDACQLLLKSKSAKQNHIRNILYGNIVYWCTYNRKRQKHKYMLQVSKDQC